MPSHQELQEALDKVQRSPEWQLLWAHLVQARQDCLLRLAASNSWEGFLEMRGELNAINIFIEFGDDLLNRLEEAQGAEDGRPGPAGYNGR